MLRKKQFILFVGVLLTSAGTCTPNLPVFGQSPQSPQAIREAAEAERARRHQKTLDEQGHEGRAKDYRTKIEAEQRNAAITSYAKTFYRGATRTELQAIAVEQGDLDYYRNLKLGPDSGIFRLVPIVKCGEPNESLEVRQWCLKYSMPGNGSRYSFRERKYRMARLADITFEGEFLKVGSFRTLGFLINLGNIEIGSVSITTPGVREIVSYQAPSRLADIEKDWYKFQNGFTLGEFTYRSRLQVDAGAVYALRSIAHRGPSFQETNGFIFDEFDFDNRRDYIVVLKILKKLNDPSITVIWRLLRDQESPEVKIPASSK